MKKSGKWSVLRKLSKKRNTKKNSEENARLEEKLNQFGANWSEALRGIDYLKSNQGTGGGHVPLNLRRPKSAGRKRRSTERCRRSDIQNVMREAMKNNFKDASIEIYEAEKRRPKSSKRERTEDDVRKELFQEEEEDEGDRALPEVEEVEEQL